MSSQLPLVPSILCINQRIHNVRINLCSNLCGHAFLSKQSLSRIGFGLLELASIKLVPFPKPLLWESIHTDETIEQDHKTLLRNSRLLQDIYPIQHSTVLKLTFQDVLQTLCALPQLQKKKVYRDISKSQDSCLQERQGHPFQSTNAHRIPILLLKKQIYQDIRHIQPGVDCIAPYSQDEVPRQIC